MLNVIGIDKSFAVDGLEPVGAWSKHPHNDVRSLLWWRELVVDLVALDEAEQQVPNVVSPTLHSTAMVPAQRLLVLGRAEEGDVACFI